jgi:hypothetical protein
MDVQLIIAKFVDAAQDFNNCSHITPEDTIDVPPWDMLLKDRHCAHV